MWDVFRLRQRFASLCWPSSPARQVRFSPFHTLSSRLSSSLGRLASRRGRICKAESMDEAEWKTRRDRIDKRLLACNPPWQLIPWKEGLDTSRLTCHAVTEFPTTNGPADYAFFVSGALLGILEAKKVTVNPQNVLEQAKRYAAGATNGPGNWKGLRVPFLYATNGEIIWHLDTRAEKLVSRTLSSFHTAAALSERFALDAGNSRRWLLDTPPEKIIRLRPYQTAAIVATEGALLAGQRED